MKLLVTLKTHQPNASQTSLDIQTLVKCILSESKTNIFSKVRQDLEMSSCHRICNINLRESKKY